MLFVQPSFRIAAVSFAQPRTEWPFIEFWCHYHASLGVSQVIIGEDRSTAEVVWSKKANKLYYHLHLNDSEIEDRWQASLARCREIVDVMTIPINDPRYQHMPEKQDIFLREAVHISKRKRFDWVLSVDIDEFLVLRQHESLRTYVKGKSDVMHFFQLIFGSRWDCSNGLRCRQPNEICEYNPNIVFLRKYIYQPTSVKAEQIRHAHQIGTGLETEDVNVALVHHFRGLETSYHKELKKITCFTHSATNPLGAVEIVDVAESG